VHSLIIFENWNRTTLCPLCGYSLVAQTDLIEKRTSIIVPSTQIKPFTEEFDEKKKKK